MGWFWGSKEDPSLANPGALIVSLFLSCDVNENHVSRLTLYYVQGPGRGGWWGDMYITTTTPTGGK